MEHRDIIVVCTSAGGVNILVQLVRSLPPGLPASLFIVNHFPPGCRSRLPEILSRSGPLLAVHACDGEQFYPGQIYVAPPDCHMLLAPESRLRLSQGPRENLSRPAADPLFRTAARYYGRRVIGVVLSGMLYDGTAGLMAIRSAVGVSVIQDPHDAAVAGMPQNASRLAGADYLVPSADLARVLVEQVHRPLSEDRGSAREDPLDKMQEIVNSAMAKQARNERQGQLSVFTCPECGGPLWQVDDRQLVRFRCHVGHVYNADLLLSEQSEALESALWTAVRTFREKSVLARQLAAQERLKGDLSAAARFEEQAESANRHSELIVNNMLNGPLPRHLSEENGTNLLPGKIAEEARLPSSPQFEIGDS